MFSVSPELEEVFQTTDGALPDIELNNLNAECVVKSFVYIRDRATWPSGEAQTYWSLKHDKDVEYTRFDNPASLVVLGEAEAFHLVFNEILSPSGFKIKGLGVFIFQDSINFDYRAGLEWNIEAITGLLELIKYIYDCCNTLKLKHSGNIYDDDGSILDKAWIEFKNT